MFDIDIKSTFILLVTVANLIFGSVVYLRNKKNLTNLLFFGVTLGVVFWSLSMVFFRGVSHIDIATLFSRILYFTAAIIPIVFLYFTFVFPNETFSFKGWQKYLLPVPFLLILLISLLPDVLIQETKFPSMGEREIVFNQFYHVIYALYIVGYFSWGYLNLLLKLISNKGVIRAQIIYIIIGTLVSTMIGVVTNLIMPFLGIFTLNWFGQIATVVMIASISYAILKLHLFNVKVIATEVLTFFIWFLILLRMLTTESLTDKVINGFLLLFAIIFGVLLIRTIIKEVQTRERIEGLVKDLAKANEHLREMEQQKSEFVSIASHQLRTPLTAIKGYASMILEGSFGALNEQARDAVEKLFKSSQRLVGLVEDFLTVSRIERGKMEFNFAVVDIQKIVTDTAENINPEARDKGIALTVQVEQNGAFNVRGDGPKLVQVLNNIIDNAIKFTTKGFVRILLTRDNDARKIRISVSDTGAGMDFNTILHLFKRFDEEMTSDRGRNVGMSPGGLGLYVSHQIIKAHGGTIWAQSEGLGKGSTFFVELPESGSGQG